MNSKPEKSIVLHNPPITVAASKMFTYPTRLASAWKPDIMEINLPEYQLKSSDIEISIRQESTRTFPTAAIFIGKSTENWQLRCKLTENTF
jgi:hypothetical protein